MTNLWINFLFVDYETYEDDGPASFISAKNNLNQIKFLNTLLVPLAHNIYPLSLLQPKTIFKLHKLIESLAIKSTVSSEGVESRNYYKSPSRHLLLLVVLCNHSKK